MAHSFNTIKLVELLTSLAQEIPLQQTRLDADFLRSIADFAPLLKAAKENGYEDLARAIAPLMVVFNSVEIEARFNFARSREETASLNIRPLNLGFNRRYSYTDFACGHIEIKVERNPLAPKDRAS